MLPIWGSVLNAKGIFTFWAVNVKFMLKITYLTCLGMNNVDISLVLEYGAGGDGHDGLDQDNHHGQGVVSCLWVMTLPVLHVQVGYQQEGENGQEGRHPEKGQERSSHSVQRLKWISSESITYLWVHQVTWWSITAWDRSVQLQELNSDSLCTFSPK